MPIEMRTTSPGGLVAWVESPNDIAKVYVAGRDSLHLARSLGRIDPLDHGYEGCRAINLLWYGERRVVVSSERSVYVRSIERLSGEEIGFRPEPKLADR
jgi:hypothetical protein